MLLEPIRLFSVLVLVGIAGGHVIKHGEVFYKREIHSNNIQYVAVAFQSKDPHFSYFKYKSEG